MASVSFPAHVRVDALQLSLTPNPVEFGALLAGAAIQITVSVQNQSAAAVSGVTVSLAGTFPAGATVSVNSLNGQMSFSGNETKNYPLTLTVPAAAAAGDYNFSLVLTK